MSEADVIRGFLQSQRAYAHFAADSITRERADAAIAALARLEAERDEALATPWRASYFSMRDERDAAIRERDQRRERKIVVEELAVKLREAEARSRLLAEALREIDALLRTPAARSEIRRFARAALAGSVPPEPCPQGCVDTEGCGCAWNNTQAVDRTLEGER